jgi:hypothetical protein
MERRGGFLCIVKLRSKSAFTTDRYTSYNKQSRSEFRRVELRLCYPPAGIRLRYDRLSASHAVSYHYQIYNPIYSASRILKV